MSPEEEFAAADAVRVECFLILRAMLREGACAYAGASFDTWAMRHMVAAEAQVRAAAEMDAGRVAASG